MANFSQTLFAILAAFSIFQTGTFAILPVTKEKINGDQGAGSSFQVDQVVKHIWNLDESYKPALLKKICMTTNFEGREMSETTQQLKAHLSEYCDENESLKREIKLERMRQHMAQLFASEQGKVELERMKNSLKKAGEKVAKFASQQDTNIQMALNKVEQILNRIKGGIPSSTDANIPEWFDKTLANALAKQPQNGNGRVATVNGIFKLLYQ
jgi:hypothetical protein